MPSSKKLPFFSLLGFLKEKRKSKESIDELAIVKAAAWAWYEHGSGSEGKPMSEYDITRRVDHNNMIICDPHTITISSSNSSRPSRYKLEAMRILKQGTSTTTTSNNSLMDRYEIESISRHFDDIIISNGDQERRSNNMFLVEDHDRDGNRLSKHDSCAILDGDENKKKKKLMRSWFSLRHGAVCGTIDDVVETRASGVDNRRRPEKRVVPVVKITSCRPRVRFTNFI